MKRRRILLIDDDAESSRKIERALRFRGWDVVSVCSLDEGLSLVKKEHFDAVVVEQCLEKEEERTGLEICQCLRRKRNMTPVVVLNRNGLLSDELSSIEAGADDWIAKPSTPTNIEARVRMRLRARSEMRTLFAGEFSLDLDSHVGRLGTREICFTVTETKLLAILLEKPGRIVSKVTLIDRIWGTDSLASDNSLQNIVKRIRKKIERAPLAPVYLLNVHGQGYRFEPPTSVPRPEQSHTQARAARELSTTP